MARQFSDEEAQRIFARAAERQHAAPASGNGLTLRELQEIGAAAGLDPEHVAAAVAEAQAAPPSVPTWQGVPLRTSAARLLPGEVSDDAWVRIVDRMRAQHQTPGVIEATGSRRVWRQHEGSLHGASVTVVPDGEGTLVTVESARASEDMATYVLSAICGMMGGIGMLAFLVNDKPKGLVMFLLMAAFALVVAVGASVSVRRRARSRPAQVSALLDQIERDARLGGALDPVAEAPPRDPEAETTDRLDLDALGPEADAASEVAPRRTRT